MVMMTRVIGCDRVEYHTYFENALAFVSDASTKQTLVAWMTPTIELMVCAHNSSQAAHLARAFFNLCEVEEVDDDDD